MCERNIDQLLLTGPQPGTWPETQACALTRNQLATFLSVVQRPPHGATPVGAGALLKDSFFKLYLFVYLACLVCSNVSS